MAGEEVRGGVVPPKEHEGAPAHLLRTLGGLDLIALWETDFDIGYALWWIPKQGRRVGSASASRQGFTYHAPLYPPAAAQDAEGVLREVAAERRRQVEVHGYDAAHDDQHTDGEIIWQEGWGAQTVLQEAMEKIPHTRGQRRALLKAVAMIVAEIERLDRSALAPQPDAEEAT